MTKRKSQELFGIKVFTWTEWDEGGDYGDIIYYNVEFPFESMKQFNGRSISMYTDGRLEIVSEDGTEVIGKVLQLIFLSSLNWLKTTKNKVF